MAVRACLLILAALSVGRVAEAVTPIEKVITLLDKLSAQISAEGKQEAADYDKFACFCKEQADEKLYAIETSEAKIEKLEAKEDALNKDIAALNDEISDLSKKITGLEDDIKIADDKRDGELKKYKKHAKDLNTAIAACEGAIDAMKESKDDVGEDGGKVDLQQLAAKSPLIKVALMQQAPAKFQYQSNDIIATLEGLLAKFKDNKAELDKQEMDQKSAYELNKQDMSNMKTFAEKDKLTKETEVERMSEDLADTKEENEEETKAKNADDDFMKVLTKDCETKGTEWDQRSKTRAAELKAISEASSMLKEKAVDNYDSNSKLVGLQKAAKTVSFLQLASVSPHAASLISASVSAEEKKATATQKALEKLLARAEKSASPTLQGLSLKLSLVAQKEAIDHFVKVRGLIKDLLTKLDAQAKDEATQKTFCDKSMSKQINIRDENKLTIEEKMAAISTATSEKAEVKARIAELQEDIAASKKAINEASVLRKEEKEANELSLKMSKEGKEAVEFALTVLRQFYESFVQKGAKFVPAKSDRSGKTVGDMAPKVFSGEYHGNSDASKGIIGILEVIASDFARTNDQVKQDEEDAQQKFEKFEEDTNKQIKAKEDEKDAKEIRLTDLKDSIIQLTDEKQAAKKALDNAEATLADLKKQCVDGEETYAERVAKREEEIAALKEAMEILDNWQS